MVETRKSGKDLENKNFSKEELFVRIKEMQKLPDEVIEKFLQSKGRLSSSSFYKKITAV
jgi:hypothetical protein